MIFKIAYRSIFRNTRRSVMTLSTIAVGAAAMLIFSAYMVDSRLGLQTITVQRVGHLTIFRNGYFDFGSGNPAAYGIEDHSALLRLVKEDAVLSPLVAVATPIQAVAGIAGNFDNDASKTFFGVGFIPSDADRMRRYNEYNRPTLPLERPTGLTDADAGAGIIGFGLARMLGLCERLSLEKCPRPPEAVRLVSRDAPALPAEDFSDLARRDRPKAEVTATKDLPRVNLLAATAGGAPNVVSLRVSRADYQGLKDVDDNYVGMHLALAQQLLYGRGAHKVTGIVLQLHHTRDLGAARARFASLAKARGLELEVRDFTELTPLYNQINGFLGFIFTFISLIIGVIVLFTVANAIGMSVLERTDEIGTTRALGVRRRVIRRQFLLEGGMLGAMGATLGLIVAGVIAYVVNRADIWWTPPGTVQPVPFALYLFERLQWPLIAGIWIGLVLMALVAALVPASRAARLPIIDALRHV